MVTVVKTLVLRRPDRCAECSAELPVGTTALWEASSGTVRCTGCARPAPASQAAGYEVSRLDPAAPNPGLPGVPRQGSPAVVPAAGASAQREFQRRSQLREDGIRSRRPRLGGLILALTDVPSSTRVWAQGAEGERAVAAKLDELGGAHLVALRDRKMLRPDGRASRANIDHLAVCAAGVWVVDAKTHHGALQVRRSGGLFGPRVERLFIGGRDKTSLLDGLARQVEVVRGVLAEVYADVLVRGALCFVGTELPWFGESIGGVPLVGRRGLGKLMEQPGDLDGDDRAALADYLDRRFVPA
jgi:hypothetical protein